MRSLALLLLLSTAAFAGKPTFEELVKKFKPATLPLSAKDLVVPKAALSVAEIGLLGISKSGSKELESLRAWRAKPEQDETMTIWPVAAISRAPNTVLIIRFGREQPMGSFSETFLLSYGPKGELLDGVSFASTVSTEAGSQEGSGTVTTEGSVGRRLIRTIPMMEEGLPSELKVISEHAAKLTASGRFEVGAEVFTTRDGAFIDRKSKEEMRVFGEKVFYRANDSKPFQALLREGDAVRFKPGGKQYVLSWDDRRKIVNCTNPDGSIQAFTREW